MTKRLIEGNALGERRQSSRRGLASDEPLVRAKLRTGGALTVLNVSSYGILAESRDRLLPGRNIDVHIVTTAGRQLVRAKVTRAYVQQLTAEGVWYRAALGFDQPIDVHSRRRRRQHGQS